MNARRHKVLTVGESELERARTAEVLEPLGVDLVHADDGYHALGLLSDHSDIDLIISTMGMEEMSGIELARIVTMDPDFSGIPILLRAPECSADELREARQSGVAEILSTEDDPTLMQASVASHLRARPPKRQRSLLLSASPEIKAALRTVLQDSGLPFFEVSELHDATDVLGRLGKWNIAFVDFRLSPAQAAVFLKFVKDQKEYERLRLVLLVNGAHAGEILHTVGGGVDYDILEHGSREKILERLRSHGL